MEVRLPNRPEPLWLCVFDSEDHAVPLVVLTNQRAASAAEARPPARPAGHPCLTRAAPVVAPSLGFTPDAGRGRVTEKPEGSPAFRCSIHPEIRCIFPPPLRLTRHARERLTCGNIALPTALMLMLELRLSVESTSEECRIDENELRVAAP
ncbi:MAG: hypothetical protein EXR71_03645 [Myxococcales bacterium]|nr:hypothetical protein [Myxococcales bacterium]